MFCIYGIYSQSVITAAQGVFCCSSEWLFSLLKLEIKSAGAEDAGFAAGWQSSLIMEPTPIAQPMRQTAVAPAQPCLCERITNSITLQRLILSLLSVSLSRSV